MRRRSFLTKLAALAGTLGFRGDSKETNAPQKLYTGIIDQNGKARLWACQISGPSSKPLVQMQTVALPSRAHEIVPMGKTVAVISRRHGDYMEVRDKKSLRLLQSLAPPKGSYFCGHATFQASTSTLFATEWSKSNEGGTGKIGAYTFANHGLKRVASIATSSNGPHAVVSSVDQIYLANGGVKTSPGSGPAKLNLGSIDSSILVSPSTDIAGKPNFSQLAKPSKYNGWLSLRHLDVHPSQPSIIACGGQDYHPHAFDPALFFICEAGQLKRLKVPLGTKTRGYVGSVCFDVSGEFIAFSCPKVSRVFVFQRSKPAYRLAHTFRSTDICGLCKGPSRGEFYATTGTGMLLSFNAQTKTQKLLAKYDFSFDNHLTAS